MANLLHLLHLGRVGYAESLDLQQQLVTLRKQQKIGDVLLLLEHPPGPHPGKKCPSLQHPLQR